MGALGLISILFAIVLMVILSAWIATLGVFQVLFKFCPKALPLLPLALTLIGVKIATTFF